MSATPSPKSAGKPCAKCRRLIEVGKAYIRHVRQGDLWSELLLCWRCADATEEGGLPHAS